MPASRKKAATIRLPRSWPSSPILVTSTRAGGSRRGTLTRRPQQRAAARASGGRSRRSTSDPADAKPASSSTSRAGTGGQVRAPFPPAASLRRTARETDLRNDRAGASNRRRPQERRRGGYG